MLSKRLTLRSAINEFDFQLMLMEFLTLAGNRSSPECSWSMHVRPELKRISSIARSNTREYLSSSFLDRFQKCLEATKRSIIHTMDITHNAQPIDLNVKRLETVVEGLKALSGSDTKQMLETSILECYSSTLSKDEVLPESEREFYGRIQKCLQPIVQYCIVLKEYYSRNNNHRRLSRSEKILPNQATTDANILDQEALQKIEQQLSKKQFYDLVRAYLKAQEQKIASTKEICRICECRINVQSIVEHVRYCQNKHRLNEDLSKNLKCLQELSSQMKKSELKLSIESKKRIRQQDEICGQDSTTLKKYKKILRYIQSISVQRRNHLQQRMKTVEIQQALQDIVMIEDDMIDRFLQLADQRNIILSKLKKNECEHFAVKQSRNHSNGSSQSQISVTDGSFNLSALHEGRLPMKAKKSGFNTDHKENIDVGEVKNGERHQKKLKTIALISKKSIQSDESQDEQLYTSEKHIRPSEELASTLSLKDFQVLGFLGKGAFGQVYLVRRLLTNDKYAMKVVKMYQGLDNKKIENIANETDIFRKISGDYLVKAAFSFSEGGLHMLFLQYMEGGDLSHLLADEVYLVQDVAKFYLAEVVLAIQHLHKLNIIHRDLKPQNLVLNSAGHLKLTDFGLSKEGVTTKVQLSQKTSLSELTCQDKIKQNSQLMTLKSSRSRKTLLYNSKSKINLIGTPDYIAPEIIKGESTENQTIDWWSFGVIVYELLVGERPFGGVTIEEVIQNILDMKIQWPPIGHEEGMMSPEAQDLIKCLLNHDYKNRLGARGVQQIKNHEFFTGINWNQIKHTKPPLQPRHANKKAMNAEDKTLRKQIEDMMYPNLAQTRDSPQQTKLNLNNFVKFDVLSEYTLKSGEQTKRRKDLQLANLNIVAQKIQRR